MMLWLWILIAVIVVILLIIWALYNSLVRLSKRIDEAWAGIGEALKKRNDMLGNLTETVKGYTKHEAGVFKDFAKARSDMAKAVDSGNTKDIDTADISFGKAIAGMRMISEQYPELKADTHFSTLQAQIIESEDYISGARKFYNAGVREFKTKIAIFPNNIFAKMLNFTDDKYKLWDTKDHAVMDEGLDAESTKVKF